MIMKIATLATDIFSAFNSVFNKPPLSPSLNDKPDETPQSPTEETPPALAQESNSTDTLPPPPPPKKLLIKIPTFGRPSTFFKTLDSFIEKSSGWHNLTIVVSANEKDKTMNNDDVLQKIKQYPNVHLFFGNHKNKIEAYNADIEKFDFDILVLASDDMIPIQNKYDKTIFTEMEKAFPNFDGVLWFDTGDSQITDTLSILGKNYYDRFQYAYNSSYHGYYCDDEFTQIAFKLGRLKRIRRKLIEHKISHPSNMHKENTYLKSLCHGTRDKALYKIRKKIQFDTPEHIWSPQGLPKAFFETKRNKGQVSWKLDQPRFDEPISSLELYILESMDKKIGSMGENEFIQFAKSYFRDFRWQIPRIIHQIWFGNIPSEIKEMMDTFSKDYIRKFPGWRYILWDEKKLENLEMINREQYENEQKHDCKSDIARLEILNKFGGVYLDSDFVWLGEKCLSTLFPSCESGILLSYEKQGNEIGKGFLNKDTKRTTNAIFGSTVANPIIAFLIGRLRESYRINRNAGPVRATGPDFIQENLDVLTKHIDLNILESKYAFPVWWCTDRERNPDYDEFLRVKDLPPKEIIKGYPESLVFHKGFSSAGKAQ